MDEHAMVFGVKGSALILYRVVTAYSPVQLCELCLEVGDMISAPEIYEYPTPPGLLIGFHRRTKLKGYFYRESVVLVGRREMGPEVTFIPRHPQDLYSTAGYKKPGDSVMASLTEAMAGFQI